MAEIKSVSDLLKMELRIPLYQRPYKWSYKSMAELLQDICEATKNKKEYGKDYKYRIGTVILHEAEDESGKAFFNIVDGQQRTLSLCLIMKCLTGDFPAFVKSMSFENAVTQRNLRQNYKVAYDFLSGLNKNEIESALEETIEVVVVCVKEESEAFQLFDSQNTRGRALDPHDLLKAYHLREMHDEIEDMRKAVTKWESVEANKIRELFADYLFPIKCWTVGKKSHTFTTKDIEKYKGISKSSYYTYASRAKNAMPHYQITSPFLAGGSFFEMVDHYLNLLDKIRLEIETSFKDIYRIINTYKSTGFKYTVTLFFASLLTYYDKFKNFDKRVVKKLFTWAFMLRVDMENLGYDSINKYAIGADGGYSNHINMFALIKEARLHTEIANLPINISRIDERPLKQAWEGLYNEIKGLN